MSSVYRHPAVRMRLIEFLGGPTLAQATAAYITQSDGCHYHRDRLRSPDELDFFLSQDLDIARSLADSASFLFHLDVEYVNFDAPAEAFLDPWRTFELQEPVVRSIESLLLQWGIRPLHLITGQGHHFVWRISRDSALAGRFIALNPAPELLEACQERVPPFLSGRIDADAHRAFGAISLVMEYVAHRIREAAGPHPEIPVEITAVHVGPSGTRRREMISVDVSEYGDPLPTRMIRMPFTNYLKPWAGGLARSLGIEHELPTQLRTIPLHEIDFRQALKMRQVDADVIDLARRASVVIPDQTAGTEHLLRDYLTSHLRQFHLRFYSDQHDPVERWPETYDRTPEALFPACGRHIVAWPNDLLLKPAGMQLITRCLLAAGWHPRHIAGFIRSKFENPVHQWGIDWNDYVPAIRADFYTRLFAGLHETGLDSLTDFNCTSIREKGFCFPEPAHAPCSVASCHAILAAGKDGSATRWPVGLSTGCFYRHSIFNVLEPIRDSGFREIEVCSFPAHLNYHLEEDVKRAGERINLLGLRPVSFHAPFADRIDITSPDPRIRADAVAELITACRAAAMLGAENVVLHPGPEWSGRPPEDEFQQRMNHAAASLDEVAAFCCGSGVRLLLENMLPHLLFGRIHDMMHLLGSIRSCEVGTCLDTGHAFLGGDLGGVFHKLSSHLKMLHISDNHGDWDAHLIPGEGTIDWPWVISELHHRQFAGSLIIEMASRENESVSDALERARRGRDFLMALQRSHAPLPPAATA